MARDIDEIIKALRSRVSEVIVVQMEKVHPADDDGLWWFRLPGEPKDIQVESPTGNCPFLVESDETVNQGANVEEVVSMVETYLRHLTSKN